MKLSWNVVFQVLAMVAQALNAFSGMVSPKWQPIVLLVVTFLQGMVAWWAHQSNPDGTSAKVAYTPPEK